MSNIEINYHPEDWCKDKYDCEDQCDCKKKQDDKHTANHNPIFNGIVVF